MKGEIYNVTALSVAVSGREVCEAKKTACLKKAASEREVLKKLSDGNFTMRGMLKSADSKQHEITRITGAVQQLDRDVENWEKVRKFVTVYLYEVAIPQFRNKKVVNYVEAMQAFSAVELSNAEKQQSCWKEFYELTKLYAK